VRSRTSFVVYNYYGLRPHEAEASDLGEVGDLERGRVDDHSDAQVRPTQCESKNEIGQLERSI
jgi:hypothetical protein